jgi:hypothetical protein
LEAKVRVAAIANTHGHKVTWYVPQGQAYRQAKQGTLSATTPVIVSDLTFSPFSLFRSVGGLGVPSSDCREAKQQAGKRPRQHDKDVNAVLFSAIIAQTVAGAIKP